MGGGGGYFDIRLLSENHHKINHIAGKGLLFNVKPPTTPWEGPWENVVTNSYLRASGHSCNIIIFWSSVLYGWIY